MRAIKITITPGQAMATEFEFKDHKDISKQLGCEWFCSAGYTREGDAIYVDDEGLLKKNNIVSKTEFHHSALAGNFVITGIDMTTGDTTAAKTSLEDAVALISKPGYGELE